MQWPEVGEIGFVGNWEICCAPSWLVTRVFTRAKERNSGWIMVYSGASVQVAGASCGGGFAAQSGDSGEAGQRKDRR
ncbi:MAG: hypothetical protein ACI8P0_006038, partial [Planctomycetaceae bacterium]